MTLESWIRAAVDALADKGMTRQAIALRVLKNSDPAYLARAMEGRLEPSLVILHRLEAASGLSPDRADPRIRRGEALAAELAAARAMHKWSIAGLAFALGLNHGTVSTMLGMGRLGAYAKPCHAIRLCDILEERMNVPTAAQTRAQREPEPPEEPAFLSLPPEARGDADYLRARRAFGRCVNPNARLFGLRRAGDGLFLADGPALSYRLETRPDRVRVVATVRRSGFVLMDREVVA